LDCFTKISACILTSHFFSRSAIIHEAPTLLLIVSFRIGEIMRVFKSTISKSGLTSLVLALMFTLGSASVSQAATFTVTSTADGGAGSLREAIDFANASPDADAINFAVSGTITLSSTLPFITVAGGPLTIDGAGQSVIISGNDSVRVISIENPNSPHSPSGAVLEVKNLTIANGRVTAGFSGGGGIVNVRGSLTVTNCVVRDNRAPHGGGVFNIQGSLTISNSNFTGNAATIDWGGGVSSDSSSTTITGSTFADNTAVTHGGGVRGSGSSAINITDSIFSGNHAAAGGAFAASYVTNVVNSTLSNNTADMGGAIYGILGEGAPFVSIRNSTLSGNIATTQGGAIYLIAGLNNVSNSTFSNNSAPEGGGVYGLPDPGAGGINNSTFFNSDVVNPFAGQGFPLPMSNTIVAGSTCSGVTDGGYNIDTGATCGFSGTSQSNFGGLLLDPAGLKDNGGSTKTIALQWGSTAINSIPVGTNGCGAVDQTDQRGIARPQGSGCDIGAFEVVPDTDGDGVLDNADPCPGTLLADLADRPAWPKKNRFFAMGDGNFVDGDGTFSGFTVVDTFGCSGTQIIQAIGIGEGHDRFGITHGVILDWIAANQ